MKTFADLKRDLQVGRTLTMTFHHFGEGRIKIIGVKREIIKVQSNGLYLKTNNDSGKSFLDLPCASLTEYDGKTIKIYGFGTRDLTAEERRLLDNEPSRRAENQKLVESDLMTDGSSTYYMDKRYWSDNGANWRYDWHKGLRYDHNTGKMWDKKIKGELELQYTLE